MEYPGEWDRLTAVLHHATGDTDQDVWRFLCHLGLVRDRRRPQALTRFSRIVAEVDARERMPGPSIAYQVAAELTAAGLTTPEARQPDPHGEAAGREWQRWRKRRLRRRLLMRWLHPFLRPWRFATALGRPGFDPNSVRHELEGKLEHGPVRGVRQCHGHHGVVALLTQHKVGWVVPSTPRCAGWFKGAWVSAWSMRGNELAIEYWLPQGYQELDDPFRIEAAHKGRQYLWVTADLTDLEEFIARAARVLPERAAWERPERRRKHGGLGPLPEVTEAPDG